MDNKNATPPGAVHGGNIIGTARKLGLQVSELLDMSSNLTPLGMAPGLREALIDRLDEILYLPEAGSTTLCEVFAARHGLKNNEVLAGNGTTEFIHAIPEALQARRAIIVNPTYGDYRPACERAGTAIDDFLLTPENNFVLDPDELAKVLRGGEIVFICNPNNPTGVLTPTEQLYDFIRSHRKSFFLVDESYLPFVNGPSLLDFPLPDNLFVLSSFSKVYGIPGLRLGILVAAAANMNLLAGRRKPWEVNRMAQVAGEYLLKNGDAYVAEAVRYVSEQRPVMSAGLAALPGVQVVPGVTNFILSHLAGEIKADRLAEKMLAGGRIMIRNCKTITGLDDRYFRLSLKSVEENAYCLDFLRKIMAG